MKRFWGFVRNETGKILGDKVVVIYFLIFPMLGLLAYGFLFMNRVGRDYPVAIVDQSMEYGSRLARHYLESAPEIEVVSTVRTVEEAMEEMGRGKIVAAMVLPPSLEKDLKSRHPVRIEVLVDARNMVNANFVLTSVQRSLGFGQAGIKFLVYKKLVPKDEALRMVLPVQFRSHALGNPSVDYSFFLFTGILIMIIQQCMLVGSAIGLTREVEAGTLAGTIRDSGGPLRYLGLRQLVYTAFQVPVLAAVLGGYYFIFRMPRVNVFPLMLFLIIFAQAVICFSQALGLMFKNRKTLLQAAVFFSMPAFFLGGYTWPAESMSPILRPLAAVLPTTPILNTWTTLTAIPDSLPYVGGAYVHEALIAAGFFVLTYVGVRIRAARIRKNGAAASPRDGRQA